MADEAAKRVTEGSPEPLGVSLTPTGVNVAVRSEHAVAIELCLFDGDGRHEIARIPLPARTGPVFHGHIAGVGEGARYGLRAHGPFEPEHGQRFNPAKLLVDPYALALDRPFELHPSMFDRRAYAPMGEATIDDDDSAAFVPKGVVTAPADQPTPPAVKVPWGETVIYELHVRGFTRANPDIPEAMRGTFAGLAHPAAIGHLKRLGVTTVELMPAAAWIDERHLPPLGLHNYWGYNPVALMAPDPRLAPGGWPEVRAATDALAAAGIETVLDVVLNHTGEGDEFGPTVSLRGLDNASYYRLDPRDRSRYVNDAGTGNTLAVDRPGALRLAMDALRAWRRLGGVGGFRFDLATTLGRGAGGFDPAAPLFSAIDQDPDLRGLKLIAEPWDIGPDGYQLGAFPASWGEWNDRFRDTVRRFWRGDRVSLGELAGRMAGSQDVFAGRRPSRSINFVVAHDGFTLADLVSYETKHNLANGEDNRDGTDANHSWNNGVEGPTDDEAIVATRLNDQRALLATLILARGAPMLSMGAEFGQSQGGDNNPYAQDNAVSWLDWAGADHDLAAFAAKLIGIRKDHPALRADRFLTGEPGHGGPYPDVAWRRADGGALLAHDWDDARGETLVMVLAEPDGDGLDRVIVAIHRGPNAAAVVLPEPRDGFRWTLLADSGDTLRGGDTDDDVLTVSARSVVVLGESRAPGRRHRDVDPAVLAQLARATGVEADWWGLDGVRHPVSPDTERAILRAMRLPGDTTHQALESLHRLAEDHDRRPLPFSMVGREGEEVAIPLSVSAGEPPPRTWLSIEGLGGQTVLLRVGPTTAAETMVRDCDGRTSRRFTVSTPPLGAGRYTVRREDRPDIICRLTISPQTGFLPESIKARRRMIGLTAQLYSLRRSGDQGVGDFTTLGAFGEAAARHGAAVVGINPLHALFPQQRGRASPYYPSDRRFLDPIYLDLEPLLGERWNPAPDPSQAPLVDYSAVGALKLKALEEALAARPDDPDFESFVDQGGEALERFAAFEAISEIHPALSWRQWPEALLDPNGAGVASFIKAHRPRIRFHQHLQWLCERQLAGAAHRARGLEIGLCRDLAIGAAPDGAEVWAAGGLVAHGVSIGAPPDPLGPLGQVWGLPPFDPHRLKADGYRFMSDLYAANMRHAGALRIDHVAGLTRQFWVPDGADAAAGAYVAFPLADLLGEIALASVEARCMVVGEDLGVVPDGLRETLTATGALTYRVLPFERDGAGFKPPDAYPTLAWACVATHDLPPLAGWWAGSDIAERLAVGLITPPEAGTAGAKRLIDKTALIAALAAAALIPADLDAEAGLTPELAAAIHGFISLTPSVLAVAQLDDLAGERVSINVPGTDHERPNWRRKIGPPIETLLDAPLARTILDAMRAARNAQD